MQALLRNMLICLSLVVCTLDAEAANLVMFDRKGCPWCAKWHAEIGLKGYAASAAGKQAPLLVYEVGTPMPDGIKKLMPIPGTPTFVLVEDGKEIDRMVGYPGREIFFGKLMLMLDKLDGASKRYKTIIVQ
jgi:hypothetical protein